MKKAILFVIGFFVFMIGYSWAIKPLTKIDIEKALSKIGAKNIQIIALEPSPIKGLTIVYIRTPQGRSGAFLITNDTHYLIPGRILDLTKNGEDLTTQIGIKKGYFPIPKGKAVSLKPDIKNSPSFGSPEAPQVIVYFDPLCPFCLRELSDMKKLAAEGKIHLVLKYFIVHGEKAKEIAIKEECLRRKKGEKAYWKALLKGGKGISDKDIKGCDRDSVAKLIERDSQEAKKIGLRGTPTSIINGKLYVGYQGSEMIKKLIVDTKDSKR